MALPRLPAPPPPASTPPLHRRRQGIFIINRLAQVKKWAAARAAPNAPRDAYVISRYIDDPLLIGGKKFDLRIYVLVTNYRPLKACGAPADLPPAPARHLT